MLVRFVGRDHPRPWNKGLLVGQKKPLEPKHVGRFAFGSRLHACGATLPRDWFPISLPEPTSCTPPPITRQYYRLVHRWVDSIGLKSIFYGTHSMRRTKVTQIYRKTGNLRAVQFLLGHTKLESTVRYLGIEVDDALHIAEQIEL